MTNRRVRVNSTYRFHPVLLDLLHGPKLADGSLVRVINLHGAPPANTMGHCYISDPQTGQFIGMVCTNSLQPARARNARA